VKDRELFEIIISVLQNPVNMSLIRDSVYSENSDHIFELNIQFCKYMWDTWQMPFIVSDAIWSLVDDIIIFGKIDGVENWFYEP